MSATKTFVIVGAGLAGTSAAESLRERGFDGRVVLIGREPHLPYDRPPLSKGFLSGAVARDSIDLHEDEWYWTNRIELYPGVEATRLDPVRREIDVGGGQRIAFDKLLLATGSSARRLAVPGSGLGGIRYLRTVDDATTLRGDLLPGDRRIVIVGGGWIGLEVAAAARGYGNDVTVIESATSVLRAALGEELGVVFSDLHRRHGVHLLLGEEVREFGGRDGVVASVRTAAVSMDADLVVAGIGATPDVALAERAGLEVDNGVVVDAYLRTNHPDIFAAGDIARFWHTGLGRRIRVEHWANARRSGALAAGSMLGERIAYDEVPYFYTDQYDLGMEFSGSIGPEGYDGIVIRGDLLSDHFVAFWIKEGRVQAGMNVNTWDVNEAIAALVRSGRPVDADLLADPAVPLETLLLQSAG